LAAAKLIPSLKSVKERRTRCHRLLLLSAGGYHIFMATSFILARHSQMIAETTTPTPFFGSNLFRQKNAHVFSQNSLSD
jgi:hypothetical protein